MCRNIRRLYNVDPPATEAEVRDAALQFVRKVSGYRTPSQANTAAFERAVQDVAQSVQALLDELTTAAQPHRPRPGGGASASARRQPLQRLV